MRLVLPSPRIQSSEWFFVGFDQGPEGHLGQPQRIRLYANDFFTQEPRPWFAELMSQRVSLKEWLVSAEAAPAKPTSLSWVTESRAQTQEAFVAAESLFRAGCAQKLVLCRRVQSKPLLPVDELQWRNYLWHRARVLASRAQPGAEWLFWLENVPLPGFGPKTHAGITPELLFSISGRELSTFALAGSRPLGRGQELLHSDKDLREHDLVVQGIVAALQGLGDVEIDKTEVVAVGALEHLKTNIRCYGREAMRFEDCVQRLHPSPALGAWPKNAHTKQWLETPHMRRARGRLGSLFGLETDAGEAACWVAIRAWELNESALCISAGAGCVLDSRFLEEDEEPTWKQESVIRRWQL